MASGRIVVITGASSGIGRATARAFAGTGAGLVLCARAGERLEEVEAECAQAGARVVAVEADVSRPEDVVLLAQRAIEVFGGFDVWVNNAGRGITRSVLDLTDEDVDEMIAVNVKSALYGMQAAVAHFAERGAGHLINVSSTLGRVPIATFRSAYSAAKAALNSLTANLRMELRTRAPGVHVTLVMPGMVTTEFARNAVGGLPPSPPWTASAPAGSMRPQTAEEVAEMIAGAIHKPVPELYTNPASAELARRYYADVGAFEAAMAARATSP